MLPKVRMPMTLALARGFPSLASCRSLCRHQNRTFSTQQSLVRVLYDGLCPICVTEIRFLQYYQRNKAEKVTFVDISLPGYDGGEFAGVSYDTAMDEMHVIDERDQVHRGIPAFSVMYGAVGLGWLGRFMMWAPLRPWMDKSYAIFARNRLKWTGRGDECRTGSCAKKTR